MNNFQQRFAILKKNKMRWLAIKPIPETSGIYVLTRTDENGFSFAYVGQAKHILTRLAEHLTGYQHIDLSLKNHGLFSENNPYGWNIDFYEYPETELNEKEQEWIMRCANKGYQLRNKTIGSQGKGKYGLDTGQTNKGYYDGLKQGWENARRYVAKLFDKNLYVGINGKDGILKQKALSKFNNFLKGDKNDKRTVQDESERR